MDKKRYRVEYALSVPSPHIDEMEVEAYDKEDARLEVIVATQDRDVSVYRIDETR